MKNDKTSLTKVQKEKTKDSRPSGIMSEEEWARVQEMTCTELGRGSSVGSFLDEWEDKYKK